VCAAVLATLTLAGSIQLWMVYGLAFLTGLANAFDNPARQAFVSEMVGEDDLTNAIGLNSAMFNGARVVGPALAGLAISLVDVGPCFAFNAISFIAVIGSLWAIRPHELQRQAPVARAKRQVREGIAYAMRTPELRMTLFLVAIVGTVAFNFNVLLPLLAKVVFHGNAGTYGIMSSVLGFGALVGALVAASRSKPTTMLLATAALAFGAMMLADAVAPTLAWEMVALALTGATSITFMSTANATVQLTSRPEMRGRVMSLYMLLFLGSTPIGGPIVGWIGERYGARWSLAIGGISCLVAAAVTVPALTAGRRQLRGIVSPEAGDASTAGAGEPAAA
jgi:MFS family permease